MKINKNGFTLIELLVVVLIIGILATIALPHYLRAVQISKVKRVLPVLKAVSDANQMHYLTNGKYADKFEDLEIRLLSTSVSNHDEGQHLIIQGIPGKLSLINTQRTWSGAIHYMGHIQYQSGVGVTIEYPQPHHGKIRCLAFGNYSNSDKLCQALGFPVKGNAYSSVPNSYWWYQN
jgi:prepilin-type N-terminal cleavage/methylation domain-containing protein